MKKLIAISFLTLSIMVGYVSAVNVSDIDSIFTSSMALVRHAVGLSNFATKMKNLRDGGFVISIEGSTQTFALSQDQKLGLVVEYQNRKAQLQADLDAMP